MKITRRQAMIGAAATAFDPEVIPTADQIAQEKARRRVEHERVLQARRGWYDKRGVRQGGLMAFIRYFWDVLEPGTELVEGWALWAIVEHLEAVTFGEITRLLINVPPGFMKSLSTNVFWPAWEWSAMGMPHLRYVAFSYSDDLTVRDNNRFRDLMLSWKFGQCWGECFGITKTGERKIENDRTGWKFASSIGGVGTGERGNRVLLDDAHNVKNAESKKTREGTVQFFREAMQNRLNDQTVDVIVAIMQRVHEEDVSGCIISRAMPYVHLMVPMEYDTTRPCSTAIGWADPRTEEGEIADPERFPPTTLRQLKLDLGPYAWCTPAESPVLMSDLSLRPIGEVSVGDVVLGFEIRTKDHRARMKPTQVLAISRSVQPVVKITFESGETARCTADHRWYRRPKRPYLPAVVGAILKRVCPAKLQDLKDEQQVRAAGWLAGFFDGEGSVSLMHRRSGAGSNAQISFCQSVGNLPLCVRLEETLNHLGFRWNMSEHQHGVLSASVPWAAKRQYWLNSDEGVGFHKSGSSKRGSRLALNQRFLHVIRPTKWREWLIEASVNGRMSTTNERVVSIEPDGVETVYGLTTETGNYVVWGLASSNSAQYQQEPAPRSGVIFNRDWWQVYECTCATGLTCEAKAIADHDPGRWPPFEFVMASLDGAYTEKEENDPTAMVVLGVFRDRLERPKVALMHAWRKRLGIHGPMIERKPDETEVAYLRRAQPNWGIVEWAANTCRRFKVELLLIEAKGPGISTAQSIQSMYRDERWSTVLQKVVGDKVARAMGVVPIFSNEMVFAPAAARDEQPDEEFILFRKWAEDVIAEMAMFPKGRYDDYTDAVTQGLAYLRRCGYAKMPDEVFNEQRLAAAYRPRPRLPLYPGMRLAR